VVAALRRDATRASDKRSVTAARAAKVNRAVRDEEIQLVVSQLDELETCIGSARLRLDASASSIAGLDEN
jgi:hypothetical protein